MSRKLNFAQIPHGFNTIPNDNDPSIKSRKYKSIGIDFNQMNSPFKALLSNISSPSSKYTAKEEQNSDPIDPTDEVNLIPHIENLDGLLSHQSQLNDSILTKLDELQKVNEAIETLIAQSSVASPVEKKPFLPTPLDDDFKESYSSQIADIPSSPESYISNTSEVEIELMDKISRLAQSDLDNKDVLKLKNVINSTLDVINFPANDQDDTQRKVMDLNDDTYRKSQVVLDKLINLVNSFT